MNLLEEEVGVKLFDRTHRGLRLTKAGQSFLKDVRYIQKYMGEAEKRARKAMMEEENLIRIGTSPLTPAEAFTEIWPQIHKLCPEMQFRIVPFENTPENAAEILGNLGQNIDVVLGIFDEALLELRKCDGFIVYDVPISISLSLDHPLAQKERLRFHNLQACGRISRGSVPCRTSSSGCRSRRRSSPARHRSAACSSSHRYGPRRGWLESASQACRSTRPHSGLHLHNPRTGGSATSQGCCSPASRDPI